MVPSYSWASGALVAQPDSLSYGIVNLPGSQALTVTLSNPNGTSAEVDTMFISGGNANADFKVISPLPGKIILPSNNYVNIQVNFTPSTTGYRTAILQIIGSNGEVDVPLNGIGLDTRASIEVVPSLVDLGDVAAGTIKDSTFYYIANGADSVVFAGIAISEQGGSGSAEFAALFADPHIKLPFYLKAGDSVGIVIQFSASDPVGTRNATYSAITDGVGSTVCTVQANVAKPGMTVLTDTIDYHSVYRGSIHDTTVMIYSMNNVPLTIVDVELPNPSFSLLSPNALPLVIPGLDSFPLQFRFNPADTGSVSGWLVLLAGEVTSGLNFHSIWVTADVHDAPLSLSNVNPIDYYCAIDTTITRSFKLTDTTNGTIIITGIQTSDSAISLFPLPMFPDTILGGQRLNLSLNFKRSDDSAYSTRLDILGGNVVLRTDTITLVPHVSASGLVSTLVSSTGPYSSTYQVYATTDLSIYTLHSLDIFLATKNSDIAAIDPSSITANTLAFPGATLTKQLMTDGKTYDVTLNFPASLTFNGASPATIWLLSYDIDRFVSASNGSEVTASAISAEKSGCLDFAADTVASALAIACGDSIFHAILGNQPIFVSSMLSENPVTNGATSLRMDLSTGADLSISIVSTDGSTLKQTSLNATGASILQIPLDVQSLPSGAYTLRVNGKTPEGFSQAENLRFVIAH
jgi:hypothetical protein